MRKENQIKTITYMFIKFIISILFLISVALYNWEHGLITLLFYLYIPWLIWRTLIVNKINYSILVLFFIIININLRLFNTKDVTTFLYSLSSDLNALLECYLLYFISSGLKDKDEYKVIIRDEIYNLFRDSKFTQLFFCKL